MKALTTIFLMLLLSIGVEAQISYGGSPYPYENSVQRSQEAIFIQAPDLKAVQEEDRLIDKDKSVPYRFGINNAVDLSSEQDGEWFVAENGDRIWRLRIEAPGARSLNFVFDTYLLPDDGKVFVYDPEQKEVLGSFTNENSNQENGLGVGLLHSSSMIIEYVEPAAVAGEGYLHINEITYGYRDIMGRIKEKAGPFGNAGACNIDVNCPEGLPFDIQKRSVAIIVVNGNGSCSGALVNNTTGDLSPLFLTANHCLGGNTGNWVFYFNHATPDCNGNENTAPTNQSVSGAIILANDSPSDFALLELNDNVPPSFQACYSGWDATDSEASATSSYSIHHPRGDVMKICFDEDAPYHANLGGFADFVWYIDEWEDGVTEPGSSGSPLFDQNGNIIGQLAGGIAACAGSVNNGEYDFYGRLGISWDQGSSSNRRLKDWLDPGNTGQLIMPNSCLTDAPDLDVALSGFSNDENLFCSIEDFSTSIGFVNVGNNNVTDVTLGVEFNGSTEPNVAWSGNLSSFQSAEIDLGSYSSIPGDNELVVTILEVNGGSDENSLNNTQTKEYLAFDQSTDVEIFIDFDNWPQEVSWSLTTQGGNELYSNAYGFGETETTESYCLGEGCYTFTMFDTAGDGICCGFGIGSYTVSDGFGNILIDSSGEYDDSESNDFCIGPLSASDEEMLSEIKLYPNPAIDQFTITGLSQLDEDVQVIRLMDPLGRVVLNRVPGESQDRIDFNASGLASGVYFVSIQTETNLLTKRLVVSK